jgi:hypothetical protein
MVLSHGLLHELLMCVSTENPNVKVEGTLFTAPSSKI